MRIEFTHSRDRRYAHRLFATSTRRLRVINAVLGACCLTPGGVFLLAQDRPWTLIIGAITLGVGLGWLIKSVILPRQLVRRLPANWFEPRSYVITDEELAYRSASSWSGARWSIMGHARSFPHAYMVWQVGRLAAVDIPRAALTPEQDRELGAFLAGLAPVGAGPTATRRAGRFPEPEVPPSPTIRPPQP